MVSVPLQEDGSYEESGTQTDGNQIDIYEVNEKIASFTGWQWSVIGIIWQDKAVLNEVTEKTCDMLLKKGLPKSNGAIVIVFNNARKNNRFK